MSSYCKEHHYAIDAANLLAQCRKRLGFIMSQHKDGNNVNANILDLDRTLLTTEQILHFHLLTLLEQERQESGESKSKSKSDMSQQRVQLSFVHDTLSDDNQSSKENDTVVSSHLNHALEATREPIMKTVEDLKKLVQSRQRRQRSMSFLNWHQQNVIMQQQQQQQNRNLRGQSKAYEKVLKAAQKISQSNNNNKINIHSNVIETHFPTSARTSPVGMKQSQSRGTSTLKPSPPTKSVLMKPMEKTAQDSLLFRLIVALQLCLVRIEEAECLLCPKYRCKKEYDRDNNPYHENAIEESENYHNIIIKQKRYTWLKLGLTSALITVPILLHHKLTKGWKMDKLNTKKFQSTLLITGSKTFLFTSTALYLRRGWRMLCMNARLLNTILAIEDLHHQWMLVHSVQMGSSDTLGNDYDGSSSDQQCKQLLKLMPFQKSSVSFLRQISV